MVDPLRAGDELRYHPGEANLRMADVVLVNKLDSATPEQVERVLADVAALNPERRVIAGGIAGRARGRDAAAGGRPSLVVEDGPTITHGGMAFGAGTVAARSATARRWWTRARYAVGSIARDVRRASATSAPVLPAMGYSDDQLRELEATINAIDCDAVVAGTPIDLGRLISSRHPIRHASYELRQVKGPPLEEVLAPIVARARG